MLPRRTASCAFWPDRPRLRFGPSTWFYLLLVLWDIITASLQVAAIVQLIAWRGHLLFGSAAGFGLEFDDDAAFAVGVGGGELAEGHAWPPSGRCAFARTGSSIGARP